jgi:DNA-binding HxlR family transcriptional regulator
VVSTPLQAFQHIDLKRQLPGASSSQISRQLKRLRVHGIIKRIGHRYKYYLTDLGRRAVLTGFKLRELFILPELNAAHSLG